MRSAVIIEGLGWFRPADHRRAWLLFDRVECLFPAEVRREVVFPALTRETPELAPRQVASGDDLPRLESFLARETEDAAFREAARAIPPADAAFARQIVWTDQELVRLLEAFPPDDPAPALSLLSSKLLLHAAREGLTPLVGRAHAWPLLARKWALAAASRAGGPPAKPAAETLLPAGLSLDCVRDAALERLDAERLALFRDENATLFDDHHAALEEAARASTDSAEAATAARGAAAARRAELDARFEERWREAFPDAAAGFGRRAPAMAPALGVTHCDVAAPWGVESSASVAPTRCLVLRGGEAS